MRFLLDTHVWIWSAERQLFDGPLHEIRCDVDGKAGAESVRVRPGAERCEVSVYAAGRMVGSARLGEGITCGAVEAQQAVGDAACELLTPYERAAAAPGARPRGYVVFKWSAIRGVWVRCYKTFCRTP